MTPPRNGNKIVLPKGGTQFAPRMFPFVLEEHLSSTMFFFFFFLFSFLLLYVYSLLLQTIVQRSRQLRTETAVIKLFLGLLSGHFLVIIFRTIIASRRAITLINALIPKNIFGLGPIVVHPSCVQILSM